MTASDRALMTAHMDCCETLPMALRHEAETERWIARETRRDYADLPGGGPANLRDAARRDRLADRLCARARAFERRAVRAGRGDAGAFLRGALPAEIGGRR